MVEVKTRRITLTNTWRHGVSVVIRAVVVTQKCKKKKRKEGGVVVGVVR